MSALSSIAGPVQEIVGTDHVVTDTAALETYAVHGQAPAMAALPGGAEETAAVLKAAAERRASVLLWGAGRHQYLGSPPGPVTLALCLRRLRGVVEYDAADLTITVEAGMTLGELRRIAGEQGQVVPLDPPGPAEATVGGVVAANLSGPMRMKHGAPRDAALGLRVALSTGEVIKTGGRTVKNVAGYDLTKLFVGSLGSLGAILEVTLRLMPAPERRAVMLATLPKEVALEAARHITSAPWEIPACELVTPAALPTLRPYLRAPDHTSMWGICVGLAGSEETVQRQERELIALLGEGRARFDGQDADRVWDRVRGFAYPGEDAVLLRAAVPPAAVGEVLDFISSRRGWTGAAHAGDGIVYASPEGDAVDTAAGVAAEARRLCEEMDGCLALESAPAELKREMGVWGEIRNADLMESLKAAYDPAGILGGGRLI